MIEKQRLEELIKQGAFVYKIIGKNIVQMCANDIPTFYTLNDENWNIWKTDYFETKEEAEFALRFKRIPKTEYLDLPTWEEFLKNNFGVKFYYKSREFHLHKVRYSADDKNPEWKINLYESYCNDDDTVAWEKEWELTKENYIEACEICRKLFLGEEV